MRKDKVRLYSDDKLKIFIRKIPRFKWETSSNVMSCIKKLISYLTYISENSSKTNNNIVLNRNQILEQFVLNKRKNDYFDIM